MGVCLSRLICLVFAFVFVCPQPALAADKGLDEASLEVMAGQMILCGFRGTGEKPLSDDLGSVLEDIRAGRVGGVVLFDNDALLQRPGRNIVSLAQTANLTALLQKDAPIPLFIGIDQEGGLVRRLKETHGAPPLPSAKEMGALDAAHSFALAAQSAAKLAEVGVNLNFAPCLDLDVNPKSPAIGLLGRSFSADPAVAAAHGLAFARGLASGNVIPCYKHFPGHGSAGKDSHLDLPDVTGTWRDEELAIYAEVLPHSPRAMVMPGHLYHARLGGDLPASLSAEAINGLLRRDLGWGGVVITDDLDMEAVAARFSQRELIRLAVLAGADILLFGNNLRHDPEKGRKAYALLLDLVQQGEIPVERIRASYARILVLKQKLPH